MHIFWAKWDICSRKRQELPSKMKKERKLTGSQSEVNFYSRNETRKTDQWVYGSDPPWSEFMKQKIAKRKRLALTLTNLPRPPPRPHNKNKNNFCSSWTFVPRVKITTPTTTNLDVPVIVRRHQHVSVLALALQLLIRSSLRLLRGVAVVVPLRPCDLGKDLGGSGGEHGAGHDSAVGWGKEGEGQFPVICFINKTLCKEQNARTDYVCSNGLRQFFWQLFRCFVDQVWVRALKKS